MESPLTHTKFADLIKKALKIFDDYNSSDLTVSTETVDQNTSGEVVGICINFGLHKIYDLIKDSRFLEAFPTTKLSTEAGKDWIDLDQEAFLDEIESITDTTNNSKLIKKSWQWYRRNYPDPSESSGEPICYIRRNSRVYIAPRPSDSRTLTIDFRKFTGDLKLAGDLPLLPSHYDYWIIDEAREFWKRMEDPDYVMQIPESRASAMGSIFSDYDSSSQPASYMNRGMERRGAWDRLI